MKHGTILLALTCWSAAGLSAADLRIPASTGMRAEAGLVALSPGDLEAIEGGQLLLDVDRDRQMMTVTRITPGRYDNIECYSVKVTTSVVRNSDLVNGIPKGAMDNPTRTVEVAGGLATVKQFPSGTANLSSKLSTQKSVTGPVIRTDASQAVPLLSERGSSLGQTSDSGYNIHYVDPDKASNTLGCIGVQSKAGMNKLAASLQADNDSYAPGDSKVQTVSVKAYSGDGPSAGAFRAKEVKEAPEAKAAPEPRIRTSGRCLAGRY